MSPIESLNGNSTVGWYLHYPYNKQTNLILFEDDDSYYVFDSWYVNGFSIQSKKVMLPYMAAVSLRITKSYND